MSQRQSVRRQPWRRTALALAAAACFPCAVSAQVESSGGMFIGLGSLGGTDTNISLGNNSKPLTRDGSVVSGSSSNASGQWHAFRWTLSGGMQDLGTLGGDSSYGRGMSLDGGTVVGGSYLAGNTAEHAFRWTSAGGMEDLGTLGGTYSYANGVSADGTVVVGYSNTPGDSAGRAFRWTSSSGVMQDLGTLGGSSSYAQAVSADGAAVIGYSYLSSNSVYHAFRWTNGDGMQDLGTLGGTYSYAYGVSADGSVVTGNSNTSDNYNRVFRWTSATGMVDLGTLGGNYSYVYGMNPSGDVVIGQATLDDGSYHGFRWTDADGMVDLGTLGGTSSLATDLSDAGDIVVGWSRPAGDSGYDAFRWTATGGMQSVRDWLIDNGVDVAEGWQLSDGGEVAISGDGKVIVGTGRNAEGNRDVWFARATGAVTLDEVAQSLAATSGGAQQVVSATNTVLNGAHSRPLDRRVPAGQKAFWVAGDWGVDDHGARNGTLGLAEVGWGINLGTVQWNAALGHTWARQDLSLDGRVKMDGTYMLAEALMPLKGNLWGTVGAYVHRGDADIRRGYLNAGNADASTGQADVDTWALRARLEWDRLWAGAAGTASPYVDLSYTDSRMDGYTETGGGFPARFDARRERATELRLGVNVTRPLSGAVTFIGTAEAVHRFEAHGARSSGEVLGLFAFDLEGVRNQRDWLRLGLGLNGQIGGGLASLMLNLTSKSDAPSAWLGLRWQMAF